MWKLSILIHRHWLTLHCVPRLGDSLEEVPSFHEGSADVHPEGPWSQNAVGNEWSRVAHSHGKTRQRQKDRWQEREDDRSGKGCSWRSGKDHLLMVGWGSGGGIWKWEPRQVLEDNKIWQKSRQGARQRHWANPQTPREIAQYLRPLDKPRPSALLLL